MKTKSIILSIVFAMLVSLTFAQTKNFRNQKVKIPATTDAVATDVVLAMKPNGLVVKTLIPVGSIGGGGPVVFEGYSESGTRVGGDLIVSLGDHDDSFNQSKITIDDNTKTITIDAGATMQINSTSFSLLNGQNGISTSTSNNTDLVGLDGLRIRPGTGGTILNPTVGQVLTAVDVSGRVEWQTIPSGTIEAFLGSSGALRDAFVTANPSKGLLHFDAINGSLEFYDDGSDTWKKVLTDADLNLSTIDWSEWASVTGTRAGGDLIIIQGDYDDVYTSFKTITDIDGEFFNVPGGRGIFGSTLNVGDPLGINGNIQRSLLTAGRTYQLPNSSGTFALTSDIIPGDSYIEWAEYLGTRAGGDLTLKLGDYDGIGNGTKITIDDDNEFVDITKGVGSPIGIFSTRIQSPSITIDSPGNGSGSLTFPTNTGANDTWFMPDTSGTVALLSDIGSSVDEWANFSGTKANGDLIIDIGDYNATDISTIISVNLQSEVVHIGRGKSSGTGVDTSTSYFEFEPANSISYLDAQGDRTALIFPGTTSNIALTMPTNSGTIALEGNPGLQGYIESGTSAGSNLLVTVGDDSGGNGTAVFIDDANEILELQSNQTIRTTNSFQIGNGQGQYSVLQPIAGYTGNKTFQFPNPNGGASTIPVSVNGNFADSAGNIVVSSSGLLEAIDEGNGDGYRMSHINAANRGNIGQRAYDFGFGSTASTTFGPTGTVAVDFGEDNILSAYGAVGFGDNNIGTSTYSFIRGSNNTDSGNGGWNDLSGYFNTISGGANTASTKIGGLYNTGTQGLQITHGAGITNNTVGGAAFGLALTTSPTHGAITLGTANADPSLTVSTGFNSINGIVFTVGNGTANSGGTNAIWTPNVKSNLVEGYRDGKFLLTSTDIIDITEPKSVITKEYADANYGGTTPTLQQVTDTGASSTNNILVNNGGSLGTAMTPGYFRNFNSGVESQFTPDRLFFKKSPGGDEFRILPPTTIVGGDKDVLFQDSSGTVALLSDTDLINDTTPQLGGVLDTNGNAIRDLSSANANVVLIPNGTGVVEIGSNLNITNSIDDAQISGNGTVFVDYTDSTEDVAFGVNGGLNTTALGTISAPNMSVAEITAANPSVLITKQYADANYSGGGGITGTGVANQMSYWDGTSSQTGNSRFTYNQATKTLSIGEDQVDYGVLELFGGASSIGGYLRIYNTGNSSTNVQQWDLTPNSGDLVVRGGGTDYIRFDDASDIVTLPATSIAEIDSAPGSVIVTKDYITRGYTVATLPTGTIGDTAYVTDATAPTYLGVLTGGGSVTCPVFYNGTNWVSH